MIAPNVEYISVCIFFFWLSVCLMFDLWLHGRVVGESMKSYLL